MSIHPRDVLLEAQAAAFALPVCDHYSGVPARMLKSLQRQAELMDRFGACVVDVTLDCEDGAPVGGEAEHAAFVTETLLSLKPVQGHLPRVGVRVHALDHPSFDADVATVVGQASTHMAYVMVPKVESVQDVDRVAQAMADANGEALPIHVLIESPAAVHRAFDIAAHPRVQSLSFGLMDFVSAHGGAIGASAMGVQGQFTHPLVVRAKLEIAAACHAHGKVPSHCVVTEFKDAQALRLAASQACDGFGYTRMWSIHPDQIEPILQAFAPAPNEVEMALRVLEAANAAQWGPVAVNNHLHDRASFRYFWQVLGRAHRTGCALPEPWATWLRAPA